MKISASHTSTSEPSARASSPTSTSRSVAASSTIVIAALAVAIGATTATPSAAASTAESLFASRTPSVSADADAAAVTVGVKFTAKAAGSITGVKFYKGVGNTGVHVGAVYSSTGKVLAKARYVSETPSGWQTVRFSSPVKASKGATYTAATYMPAGHYAVTDPYSWPAVGSTLTGSVGTYQYGTSLRYPASTYQKSNYFVDVMIEASVAETQPTVPPTSPPISPSPTPPTPLPLPTTTPATPPPTSGYPSAANTGVPSGTSLSAYTGPAVITAPGTVIDGKKITSCLVVRAMNVTVKNSLIQAGGCFFNVLSDNGSSGLKLVDVEIDGQNNASGDSAVAGENYTCLRCNIHGTIDGLKAGSNVVVQSSYVHDLTLTADSHNDGIQSLGTTNLQVRDNTIIVGNGATSAIILSTGSADAMRNVTISGNLLGGGAYTVYGGYQTGSDSASKVSNISITGNQVTTRVFPKGGYYGPFTSVDSPVVTSANTWADGPNAGDGV
ncbi:DUF4082 domain-containing protein [uncultured Friedmanniella sp.]|uniref:DUF4082 domain-containing protein n=1 Tax=uncultured Friedmanniella sp. TaxID=335381 RepID=UPI0035CAA2E3